MSRDPHDHPARVIGQCLLVIFVVCSLARTLLPADPPLAREISATPEARRCVMHYNTRYQRDGRPVPVRYSTCTAMRDGRAVFVAEGN